jgi:2,5-furandicarboxylate decarboxylase 1
MAATFRQLLDDLRAAGELVEISKPVDIRYIAALVDQAETALLFTNVIGYDMPVVSGVLNSRERLSIAMDCPFDEIEGRVRRGLDRPVDRSRCSRCSTAGP